MTEFTAKFAFAGEVDEILTAGLADDQFDTVEHILFQWDDEEEDVWINVGDQIRQATGGIESIELSPNALRVLVNPATAAKLQTDCEILVRFDPALAGLDELAKTLAQMLGEKLSDRRS